MNLCRLYQASDGDTDKRTKDTDKILKKMLATTEGVIPSKNLLTKILTKHLKILINILKY